MPQGMPVKLASPDGSTSFFGSLFIRMSKAVCSTNVQTVYNIGRMKKEEAIRNLGAQEAHVLKNTTYANTSSPRTIAQKDGDVKKLAKIEETSASSMPYKTGTAIGAEVSSSGDIIPKTAQNEDIHQILSKRLQLPQAVSDDTLVSNDSIQNQQENASGTGVSPADAAPVNPAEKDPREIPEVKAVLEDENAPQGEQMCIRDRHGAGRRSLRKGGVADGVDGF